MRRSKHWAVYAAITQILLFVVAPVQAAERAPLKAHGYIFKFKSQSGMARASAVTAMRAMAQSLGARELSPTLGIYKIDDASRLPQDGSIERVERDLVVSADIAPSAPKSRSSLNSKAWGAIRVGTERVLQKGINGEGITIAVIDSGVQADHPALQGKILSTGYDFYNADNDPSDDYGHGTHVAGIIAGKEIGVAQGVKILPLKFLNRDGDGLISDAIRAIEYAREQHVQVMNHSWGTTGDSTFLEDAILAASRDGILSVAAAGNVPENNDVSPSFPANYATVVSVAATDTDESLWAGSAFGRRSVHVAAPGAEIYSSVPPSKYGYKTGTSMATPVVAAIAALVLSQRSLTPDELKTCLTAAKDPKLSVVLPIAGIARISATRALEVCK